MTPYHLCTFQDTKNISYIKTSSDSKAKRWYRINGLFFWMTPVLYHGSLLSYSEPRLTGLYPSYYDASPIGLNPHLATIRPHLSCLDQEINWHQPIIIHYLLGRYRHHGLARYQHSVLPITCRYTTPDQDSELNGTCRLMRGQTSQRPSYLSDVIPASWFRTRM